MTREQLLHLVDRARRGVILPAEGEALAALVGELEAAIEQAELDAEQQARHFKTICGERESYRQAWKYEQKHRALAAAEITRLTAGQCIHALHMCQQHHAVPVDGCPYPKCISAQSETGQSRRVLHGQPAGVADRHPPPGGHESVPDGRLDRLPVSGTAIGHTDHAPLGGVADQYVHGRHPDVEGLDSGERGGNRGGSRSDEGCGHS